MALRVVPVTVVTATAPPRMAGQTPVHPQVSLVCPLPLGDELFVGQRGSLPLWPPTLSFVGFRACPEDPGGSHLKILNLVTSAKTFSQIRSQSPGGCMLWGGRGLHSTPR